MKTRELEKSGLRVSAGGLGCMGMSEFYGPSDEKESIGTVHHALDSGVSFWDMPIPGTRRQARVDENAAAVSVELSAEDLGRIGQSLAGRWLQVPGTPRLRWAGSTAEKICL